MTDNLIFVSEWMGVIAVTLLLTMNRRFTARPVAFKYQRREVILSSILAVLLIAASVYTNLRLEAADPAIRRSAVCPASSCGR